MDWMGQKLPRREKQKPVKKDKQSKIYFIELHSKTSTTINHKYEPTIKHKSSLKNPRSFLASIWKKWMVWINLLEESTSSC